MSGAVFALCVNCCLALLLAAGFSYMQTWATRFAWWQGFSLAYFIGSLMPLSELLVRFEIATPFFLVVSFASFLGGQLLFAKALATFYGVLLPRWFLPALFTMGLGVRAVIWGGQRDNLFYEIMYQAPFSAALLVSVLVLLRQTRAKNGERVLTCVLVIAGLHFLAKAGAAHFFGSGPQASAYYASQYALVSQSVTAVVLVAIAITMIAILLGDAIDRLGTSARTDHLSGLFNRRGFDEAATTFLRSEAKCVAVMCDLDHFKSVNDVHGHAAGDLVIEGFAKVAQSIAPAGSILGRTGGEEFSLLLPLTLEKAVDLLEQILAQQSLASTKVLGEPVTVSIGLAEVREDGLSSAMREADRALYLAKSSGRNCVKTPPTVLDNMPRHPMFQYRGRVLPSQ